MTDLPPHSEAGDNTGVGPDRGSATRTPRWVKIFGIISLVLVLVVAILHLTGHREIELLIALALLKLLSLLILVLAIIQDFCHWRLGVGCNFRQIVSSLVGEVKSFANCDNSDLLTIQSK